MATMVASVGLSARHAVMFAPITALQAGGQTLRPDLFLDVFETGIVVRKVAKEIVRTVGGVEG